MKEHNLTKKEIAKVTDLYNLGEAKNVRYLPGGMINYVFVFKTNKGIFIVRKLGYQYNKYWRRQKRLEFEVIDFLKNNKFPYQVPNFKKNKYGNFVSRLGKSLFEVYENLDGNTTGNLNKENMLKVAKALSIYHKTIKNYKPGEGLFRIKGYSWILGRYNKMKRIACRTEIDRLMLKNIDFFENLLKEMLKINLRIGILATHSDFSFNNLLFNGNKLVAILDFENISFSPKAYDLAYNIRKDYKLAGIFLKTYRKYNSFSSEEEKLILPLILLNLCNQFWFIYSGMKKRPDLKIGALNKTINEARKFYKIWREQGK